jgi:hypothetical protein
MPTASSDGDVPTSCQQRGEIRVHHRQLPRRAASHGRHPSARAFFMAARCGRWSTRADGPPRRLRRSASWDRSTPVPACSAHLLATDRCRTTSATRSCRLAYRACRRRLVRSAIERTPRAAGGRGRRRWCRGVPLSGETLSVDGRQHECWWCARMKTSSSRRSSSTSRDQSLGTGRDLRRQRRLGSLDIPGPGVADKRRTAQS